MSELSTDKRNCLDESLLEPHDDRSADELEFPLPCPCDGPGPIAEMSSSDIKHVLLHMEAKGLLRRTGEMVLGSDGELHPVFAAVAEWGKPRARTPGRRKLN